ncbi:hypothetical protein BVC80_8951g9 [Macleaya cordata]|uniref:Uncharacterized protein n=1 Tax=Macleaya cordata TaxID=56857 RepID=A0A200QWW3_MACCD|nr:hypothetical protein BVC80_8951g9 [Macleaya cordata]
MNQEPGLDEPITFDSHVLGANIFLKDAIDTLRQPKQIHHFYFIKCPSYEDPELKTKIYQAEKEIKKKIEARICCELFEQLRQEEVISQLKPLALEDKRYGTLMVEKRNELETLRRDSKKLHTARNTSREKSVGLCSSVEELNGLIFGLQFRMQHQSNMLAEEKQLLREIKQLEGTREKIIGNFAMKVNFHDSVDRKASIQDLVERIEVDLDSVRESKQLNNVTIKEREEELKDIDNEISFLQLELTATNQKRWAEYEVLVELKKQRDEGNAYYYQNCSLLNNARELAAKKDIVALEELSHTEVENFMSLWSSSKAFRDDYMKRILPSLDCRQLSRDGRIRNNDEKPLVSDFPTTSKSEMVRDSESTVKDGGDLEDDKDVKDMHFSCAKNVLG